MPAAITALITVGIAPQTQAHFDSQAGFEVKEVFDSSPSERLRAIADHMAKFGYDAFDLQLMVEATIKYGVDEKRQGNPPLEGAIHDAMEAARLGEQLDPKRAPWSRNSRSSIAGSRYRQVGGFSAAARVEMSRHSCNK